GRSLRDGTLVSTASVFRGETVPFDIETVSLRIRSDTMTLNGTVGITDRFDVSAGIPFVRVTLQGERIDTYRGRQLLQGSGSAAGRTCCSSGRAVARWEARCGCQLGGKKTCSAPAELASHRASWDPTN